MTYSVSTVHVTNKSVVFLARPKLISIHGQNLYMIVEHSCKSQYNGGKILARVFRRQNDGGDSFQILPTHFLSIFVMFIRVISSKLSMLICYPLNAFVGHVRFKLLAMTSATYWIR